MQNPTKEQVKHIAKLMSEYDQQFEDYVLVQAQLKSLETQLNRTMRDLKLEHEVPDAWGLDLQGCVWMPPEMHVKDEHGNIKKISCNS